jgi:hypothetical protein
MPRNPAYEGKVRYGKNEQTPRQRMTRPLRQKNGISNRTNCRRDQPRADWIEVSAPALVSYETFALAQEQLTKNTTYNRKAGRPVFLAADRTSARTSKQKLYYDRFLGSDSYGRLKVRCKNSRRRRTPADPATLGQRNSCRREEP